MAEAFDRCRSEAAAAFGDGSVFVERLVARPRHIEVQVLADATGDVVHLHERDCSVQLRNQKVVEVAPAPALDDALRARILADAVTLVAGPPTTSTPAPSSSSSPPRPASTSSSSATPASRSSTPSPSRSPASTWSRPSSTWPAGATLASLGLGDQAAVGPPRGFAVQARVVATGAGTLTAYKEPSGPRRARRRLRLRGLHPAAPVRPPAGQGDRLGRRRPRRSPPRVDRTLRALDEFHIAGLPTNLGQLRAILAHPDVRAGDARTTLLAEQPRTGHAPAAPATGHGALSFLDARPCTARRRRRRRSSRPCPPPRLVPPLDGRRRPAGRRRAPWSAPWSSWPCAVRRHRGGRGHRSSWSAP